ncbi:MAG: ABC transporter permease [Rhodoglobus sp.]
MTTSSTTRAHSASPLTRITNVTRVHFANPWTTLTLPWIILGAIFAGNLVIWWILYAAVNEQDRADVSEGLQFSGASFYIFIYLMVVAIQAISITFPFALGYGVTRRDYYLGTSLTFVILAAIYTAGLTVLSIIEDLTNGWGFGAKLFSTVYFGDTVMDRIYVMFLLFLFFLFFGAAIATVWLRWKANGVLVFFGIVAALLLAGVAVASFTQSWGAIAENLVSLGQVGIITWSLVPTTISALAGYFLLRRATPRNSN